MKETDKDSILAKNPLVKYLKFLMMSRKSNNFYKCNGFSIEEVNLLSFLKSPISYDKFNEEIYEALINLNFENLSNLEYYNYDYNQTPHVNKIQKTSNSYNFLSGNNLSYQSESLFYFTATSYTYNSESFQAQILLFIPRRKLHRSFIY